MGSGRERIPIEKIQNENAFSKLSSDAFKKANELATLCGAMVALIFFSPSGKLFAIGFPNVKTVIDMFLNGRHTISSEIHMRGGTVFIQQLNEQLSEIKFQYDEQKAKKVLLEARLRQASEDIKLRHSKNSYAGNSLDRLVLLEEQMLDVKQRLVQRNAKLEEEEAAASALA